MGIAKSAKSLLQGPVAVNGSDLTFTILTFTILIASGLAGRAAGFFLARRCIFRAQSNIGKFKIAVGAVDRGELKFPGFRRVGRARSYPNFICGSTRFARLVFSGHVDHQLTINSPACMRSHI